MESNKLKIAALSDIHIQDHSKGSFVDIFAEISKEAQVLLLCGDLTHNGFPKQAEILCEELTACKIPILAVLGNHDHEDGQAEEIKKILTRSRVTVLDGTSDEIQDVGFAGSKGFCGGFGKYMLASFGEEPIKKFVSESVEEALRLEKAIAKLPSKRKVVILHYSPIAATVFGEPQEIYPFLGSSRLEEPIDRYGISMVFHGHAHHGTPEGVTAQGVPVYNVSYSLMQKLNPKKPYRIVEI